MAKLVLPRVQALLVCDVCEESSEEEGVYHLSGVRSVISAQAFPFICPRIYVYLQVSGHMGEAACRIELVQAKTDDVIHQTATRVIPFENPMQIVPIAFRLRNCTFPAPGVYYVQAHNEGKLICERLLHVVEE